MEKMFIRGVAKDEDVARVSIVGVKDEPGVAFRVFSILGQKKINVDIILQSIGRDGTKDITFTVENAQLEATKECLQPLLDSGKCKNILCDSEVAKVSVVGAGMETHPGVAATMFEALYTAGINIQMISTSEIKISVLIDKKYANEAMRAVHDAFIK